MRRDKLIAANLKATDEQLVEDLNGVLSTLQKKMMRTMLTHIDELAKHIKELDDEIDRNMKDEEKIAAANIQEIPGIGNTSAEAVIAVISTDMSRFQRTDIFPLGLGCAQATTRVRRSASQGKPERETPCCVLR